MIKPKNLFEHRGGQQENKRENDPNTNEMLQKKYTEVKLDHDLHIRNNLMWLIFRGSAGLYPLKDLFNHWNVPNVLLWGIEE